MAVSLYYDGSKITKTLIIKGSAKSKYIKYINYIKQAEGFFKETLCGYNNRKG